MPKILLINHDPVVRRLVREYLSLEGFEILDAEGGETGINMAQMELPDVILCGRHLPEMNAVEVLHGIRADSATRNIPFILFADNPGQEEMEEELVLGVSRHFVRPWEPAELKKVITELLN